MKEANQKAAKRKTIEQRQIKRVIKASIIPVPDNNCEEFIDETIVENGEEDISKSNFKKNIKLDESSSKEFTILGGEHFIGKKKVRITT